MNQYHRHILIAGLGVMAGALWIRDGGLSTHPTNESAACTASPSLPAEAITGRAETLPVGEVRNDASLAIAVSEARHAVSEVDHDAGRLPENEDARYFAFNPNQQLSARFRSSGVRIDGKLGGAPVTITRDTSESVPTDISADGSRVEYRHSDGVLEWWQNGGNGLEQGFAVPFSPARRGGVKLSMTLSGMHATADPDRPGDLVFSAAGAGPAFGYRNLKAWDAEGALLSASMQPTSQGFEITVAANDATFPITIDPVVVNLQHTLIPPAEGTAELSAADAMAISGNHAALGMPFDQTVAGHVGSVYLFEFQDESWKLITRLLPETPTTDPASTDLRFGSSLCFYGDELLVAAPGTTYADRYDSGAVYAFSRQAKGWKNTSILRVPQSEEGHRFIGSLAASGTTLCVHGTRSGDLPDSTIECFWVFDRRGRKWLLSQQFDSPGSRLAIDGDLIANGGPDGVDVFRKEGATWAKETRLEDPVGGVNVFGNSVDVSDGRILVGAPWGLYEFRRAGTAHVFQKVAGAWQESHRIFPTASGAEQTRFGSQVRFDGNTAYISAPGARAICTYQVERDFAPGQTIAPEWPDLDSFGSDFAVAGKHLCSYVSRKSLTSANGALTTTESFALEDGVWRPTGIFDPGIRRHDLLQSAPIEMVGDRVFLGAPRDSTARSGSVGAVFIFQRDRDGWRYERKLMLPEPDIAAGFGSRLSAIPGRLVVAASKRADSWDKMTPMIYVYNISGSDFQLEQILETPTVTGVTLATHGDRILVGAPTAFGNLTNRGEVHAFSRVDGHWILEQTLVPPDSGARFFGTSLVIRNDVAWIGCPLFNAFNAGKVYGFRRQENGVWQAEATLQSPFPSHDDRFGSAIALSDEWLWIGSPLRVNPSTTHSEGGVSVQKVNGTTAGPAQWIERPVAATIHFGTAIKASGDLAVVQCFQDFTPNSGASRLTLFQRSGSIWEHGGTIEEPEPASRGFIAMAGDTIVQVRPGVLRTSPDQELREGVVDAHQIASPLPEIAVFLNGKKKPLGNRKTVKISSSATELVLQVRNLGDSRLVDLETRLDGPDADSFEVSQPGKSGLDPQENTAFSIRLAPGSTGRKSARLRLTSNDGDESPFILQLDHTPRP